MEIGQRIREIRENKELSTRKLASMSGISASLVSQIETGKVEPSVSSLRKIALALDVPLFYLVLENPSRATKLVRIEDRSRVDFPDAGLEYEIIHSDFQKKMGIMIGTLKPGGATSVDLLAHSGEECLIILDGSLKIEVGREILELMTDDSLYFDSSVPHRLFNDSDIPCRFYLIITPPKF